MRKLSVSVVAVLLAVSAVVASPADTSASGFVIGWDNAAPVGTDAFVRGVAPADSSAIRTPPTDTTDTTAVTPDTTVDTPDTTDATVVAPDTTAPPTTVAVDEPAPYTTTPVSLTFWHSSPKPVGTATRVAGRVTGHTGGEVHAEVFVNGIWQPSAPVTSSSTGYFSIPLTHAANTAGVYQHRVVAVTPDEDLYSATFDIVRTATIRTWNSASKPVGTLAEVAGRVTGHTRGDVFTQVLVNGEWRRSQTMTSSSTGYFRIPLTYGINGPRTYTYRVGAITPAGTIYSNTFTITRTPITPPRAVLISDSAIAGIRWTGNLGRLRNARWETHLESCRRLVAASCRGRYGYPPRTALAEINNIRRTRGQAGSNDLLIIAVGYNDWHGRFASDFREVNSAALAAGFRQVVWLTYRTGVSYSLPGTGNTLQSNYAQMNRVMAAALSTDEWPEVSVWDYASYTATKSSWFTRDGVHLTPSGARAIADWLSARVASYTVKP